MNKETTTSESKDRRRHRRYEVKAGDLQVCWLDQTGTLKVTRTHALNNSENGIALQLQQPVLPMRIRYQSGRFNIQGIGAVRQCRRAGQKYVVGLEFTEGLRWRAPVDEVPDPIPLCSPE
jgi:hypothetical protein